MGFKEGIIPVEIDSNKVYIYTFAGLKVNALLSIIFILYNDKYDIMNCTKKSK